MPAPALAAVLALGGCADPDAGTPAPSTTPSTTPSSSSSTGAATGRTPPADVLVLDVPAVAGRCRPPDAALLRRQDVAVRGEVTEAGGAGTVRLRVVAAYRGEPGAFLEVDAPPEELGALLLAPDLEPGGTYLLAARASTLAVCGASGAATSTLTRLYERAYGVPR